MIDKISEMLLSNSRQEAEALVATAQAEADHILADAEQKAQAEAAELCRDYERKTLEFERRDQLNEKMQKRRMLLHAKQELVNQAIERVHDRFLQQSDAQWVELLTTLLRRNHQPGHDDVPEIVVPAHLADAVRAALDSQYPVRAASIRHGFLFSFEQYDLNYEAQRLFTYQNEKFEQEAARYLFNGDADE